MLFAAVVLRVLMSGNCATMPGEIPVVARPASTPVAILGMRDERPVDPMPSPCVGDYCQPLVAIPGWKAHFDPRGSNGLLIVAGERLPLGPISTAARIAGIAGLRVEYRPGQNGALPTDPARHGRFMVGFRWRLDPWNGPGWLAALTGPTDPP